MKATRLKNGTVDLQGIPGSLFDALLHAASDMGAKNAILRYDERDYNKYARPNKATRKLMRELGNLEAEYVEFFDTYEDLGKPKFAKRRHR